MNALKLLAVGAVVCLMGVSARAEEKVDYAKMIVGKWTISKADEGTVPTGTVVEFTKDGKMKIVGKKGDEEFTMEGTYKVEGNKFTMTHKVGDQERSQTITISKISAKEMDTENAEGKKVSLTKK